MRMIKAVFGYWQDACQLFGKDQRKLFALVTLNNLVKSFRAESGMVGMIAVLFLSVMLTLNASASMPMWERAFSLFSLKSLLGVKLLGVTKTQGVSFFGGLLSFSLAIAVIMRPSLERKDGRYLLSSLIKYLPFFIIGQELVLLLPFFAYLYMDMKNSPLSFLKALRGTGFLVLCHLPVVVVLLAGYGLLLAVGKYLVYGALALGLPSLLSLAILPMLWFVLVFSLFFSACAMYYTKVKHADRQLLFGS